jgi:DNA-3-methyladenine glycosylase
MKSLQKSFFNKSTIEVAKALLGCSLVHETKEGISIGKIIETEAYLQDDPASHSFKGKTKRNEAMFGSSGRAYVYFTYGMYNCFNVSTNKEGIGEAVLIRALEPVKGVELMKKRRQVENIGELCDGPAKLVIAMGITKKHNNANLANGNLRIIKGEKIPNNKIIKTARIGISKGIELPYRFILKE